MKYIELHSYTNYIEANIVLGRLQEEGINCWLKNENLSTIAPVLFNAFGGIKLMVAEEQVERAISLLNE